MSKPLYQFDVATSLSDAMDMTANLRNDHQGFEKLAKVLHEATGIYLPFSEKNLSLMASRIAPLLRSLSIMTYTELNDHLARSSPELISTFITALTTNTTEFFREDRHFEILAKLTPELVQVAAREGRRDLRIWCAASSTGQEPYTTMMTLHEAGLGASGLRFLATDVDMDVLNKAARGSYSDAEMRSVSPYHRQKYFDMRQEDETKRWSIKPSLAKPITFAQFNLMTEYYPFKNPFDVIFCRNVLIYFDREDVSRVLSRLLGSLRPGGYLFLGHSESGTLRNGMVTSIATAVYRKKDKA